MDWRKDYASKLVSIEKAASFIKSGDVIYSGSGPSAPYDLLNAIAARYEELEDVTIGAVMYMAPVAYLEGKYKPHITNHSMFVGPLERMFMPQGNIKVTSCNLSLADKVFTEQIKGNVLVMECAAPDERGYLNYGPGGGSVNHALLKTTDTIIVQVNKNVPYVYGAHAQIHVSQVDYICECNHEIPVLPEIPVGDLDKRIASHIVDRIPDGATIQIGLGEIANAVGFFLEDKKDLGAHTEMITDSMVDLTRKGVINCSKKKFRPGKITFGFGVGSRDLYEFMDKNPILESMPIYQINDINNIAVNDNFISINNALTVDLTGQVCSESIGHEMYSCTGGQLDFVLGAAKSEGGKSFIALKSSAETGNGPASRIVSSFLPGTVVTTPRSVVQYVVTEYGIADLWLKSIPERVKAMVSIAHPDFREDLMREAHDAGLLR